MPNDELTQATLAAIEDHLTRIERRLEPIERMLEQLLEERHPSYIKQVFPQKPVQWDEERLDDGEE
jgi:uncharacterized protein YicC (UPF0701 family)